jgi:hypothetical protein
MTDGSAQSATGYETSFAGLFHPAGGLEPIRSVQIPLVQRDYAQGRRDPHATAVRAAFLDVLHRALTTDDTVGLDFVYGDVVDGRLLPLDGQQRLTTLFLLHWYLCCRNGLPPSEQPWSEFSYDTRMSARQFCERLVASPPAANEESYPSWIVDQWWYLYVWKHDPTIQSMLTMLVDIEERFRHDDLAQAWVRLVDTDRPPISFQLLHIDEVGPGDQLYIKMNSRGRPLTQFETFKGRLEQITAWSEHADSLKHLLDLEWADLLWNLRGDDDDIDDEYLRYLEFVIEICEWREDRQASGALHERAERVFGQGNPGAVENLRFLLDAFDWPSSNEISSTFGRLFTVEPAPDPVDGAPVVLFGTGDVEVNLFKGCCERYGVVRGGGGREFSLGETLLLYGVLLHRIYATSDAGLRLRTVRNLVEASINELRASDMPELLRDVSRIVLDGDLDVKAFNQNQAAEELRKADFLSGSPHLAAAMHRLEDSDLLRGSVDVIPLDPGSLESRSEAFLALFNDRDNWRPLTAALTALGDYHRARPGGGGYQFGTGASRRAAVWRDLLTRPGKDVASTRESLCSLLDGFAASHDAPESYLRMTIDQFLSERRASAHFDWRYYLAAYEAMRAGDTGIYFGGANGLGYSLAMLRTDRYTGNYRDAFLHAVHVQSGSGRAIRNVPVHKDGAWFTGYPDQPRWMLLDVSGTGIRCVDSGFLLLPPTQPEHRTVFDSWTATSTSVVDTDDGLLLRIPQVDGVDSEDRVLLAAEALRQLVDAGL